jgi:hypothetical protein
MIAIRYRGDTENRAPEAASRAEVPESGVPLTPTLLQFSQPILLREQGKRQNELTPMADTSGRLLSPQAIIASLQFSDL